MKLFNKNENFYGEIRLKYDSRIKNKRQEQYVKGDDVVISALVGALIYNLIKSGFDRELLENAIKKGLRDSKKEEKIEVKEIHISDENAKDLAELLKRIVKEEN